MATRVGYIGLGDMGKAMASNLVPSGFDTRVYDLDPKPMEELAAAGAQAASSCREVGEHAEVLSVCVPGDPHVEAVLLGEDGALAGMAAGSLVAIHSTVQPATVLRIAPPPARPRWRLCPVRRLPAGMRDPVLAAEAISFVPRGARA